MSAPESSLTNGRRPAMLICDIDGTLTDEHYGLHPGFPEGFRRLESSRNTRPLLLEMYALWLGHYPDT